MIKNHIYIGIIILVQSTALQAQYLATPGNTRIDFPNHLSSTKPSAETSTEININGAVCYGNNTRFVSNPLQQTIPGRTWIRITFLNSSTNQEVGKFSIPFEVFQVVKDYSLLIAGDPKVYGDNTYGEMVRLRNMQGATVEQNKYFIPLMINALYSSNTPSNIKDQLVTPDWTIEAYSNSVKVSLVDEDEPQLAKVLQLANEKKLKFTYDVLIVSGFAPTTNSIDAIETVYPVDFFQGAAFRTSLPFDDKIFVLADGSRSTRAGDDVTYTVYNDSINLVPTLFGSATSGCGGLTSPLMVFEKQRPAFTGQLNEKNNLFNSATTWTEKNHPGYFLVLDKNTNKKIDRQDELFGDQDGSLNGFESLRRLDTNKDHRINKQDHAFSKLQLWKDINADGLSSQNELFSISYLGITEFSLKYETGRLRSYNGKARSHQESKIKAINPKTNKETKYDLVDIWFERLQTFTDQVAEKR